jgi:predicted glycogen debranching enzyme
VSEPVRRLSLRDATDRPALLGRRWLATNGLGGFASGTIAGVLGSRYHALLVAALGAPLGRVVMLNHLLEQVQRGEEAPRTIGGGDPADPDGGEPHGLVEFRLERGLPVWRFELDGAVVEKRVLLPYMQNTVHVTYCMLEGTGRLRLRLRPSMHFRPLEAAVSESLHREYVLSIMGARFEVAGAPGIPPLRILFLGERPVFSAGVDATWEVFYRAEAERGYEARGPLWTPGAFSLDLAPGCDAGFIASTEPWAVVRALSPADARDAEGRRRRRLLRQAVPGAREGLAAELVLAADQFVITPVGRSEDLARSRAAGDEMRTVIAGYHWFTDWGRDTMITLEGLTLCTGRVTEAGWILRTFAHYIRDGLIPNVFPEGEKEGLYHTADATLWFFHALDRYLAASGDRATLQLVLPKLERVLEHHLQGTRFGIGVDPADGLLRQGAPGYQLTWMDAKVDDWVVTPRRGKAVEVNALWYNALRLMQRWMAEEAGEAAGGPYAEHAARAREAFNRRFWYAEGGYCYDVVDGEQGDDAALRPNQLFAVALPHPVLEASRWPSVLARTEEALLTPVGLRSLAPGHPDYKAKYFGDLRARDAAYHQGTVWGWLIGPFVDAYLKVHPGDRRRARGFLAAFERSLEEHGVGSLSEIFDAEQPFTPRGCISQAWSVAEVLRTLVLTAAETADARP